MTSRRSSEVRSRRRFLSRNHHQERVVSGRGASEGSSHHLQKPRSLRANTVKSTKSVKSSYSLIEPQAAKRLQSPDLMPLYFSCRRISQHEAIQINWMPELQQRWLRDSALQQRQSHQCAAPPQHALPLQNNSQYLSFAAQSWRMKLIMMLHTRFHRF